jgi:UTP-glucose-1-phosphate uridylyltransferase
MKNVRLKARKYGVVSQKYVSFLRAEKLLRTSGIVLNNNNKNCLFMHNSHESTKHWIIKSIIFKILRERNRTVGAEIELRGGIVDVLDVDNFIGYEVESNINKKSIQQKSKRLWRLHDVVFIDVKKVPDSIEGAEKYLKKLVV